MPRPTRPPQRESRSVGTVLAVTPSGRLTVRADSAAFPPEGTEVFGAGGRPRGQVVRVFGPVPRPYLSVRLRRSLSAADALGVIGQTLHAQGEFEDGSG